MTGRKHEWYFDECIHCGTRRLLLRSKRPVVEHFVAENAAAGPIAAMTADRDAWAAESAENLRKLVAATARIDAMRDDIITLGAQVNSLMRERDAALAQVATAYEAGAAAATIAAMKARKIKPLEWEEYSPGCFFGRTEFGDYAIAPSASAYHIGEIRISGLDGGFTYAADIDAAKAAAQADYEARVWAAFEDAPAGDTPGSMSIEGESQ